MNISNKKAYHNYFIEEKFTAGIALKGSEVKSLRNGKVSLDGAWISVKNNEAFLFNSQIQLWGGTHFNHTLTRTRKLLLKKSEIFKMQKIASQKNWTIIPLKIFFKGRYIKVEIGLARGKHNWDKRAVIKENEQNRDTQKKIKEYNKKSR